MKRLIFITMAVITVGACGDDSQEAPRYEVPIYTDGSSLVSVETDRGYEVEIKEVIHRVESVEFTVGGETHASLSPVQRLYHALVPDAVAHPNHAASGEVAGALDGPLILAYRQGEVLEMGRGAFLEGQYAGYNLKFYGGDDAHEPDVQDHFHIDLQPAADLMALHRGVVRDGEGNEYELVAEVTFSSFSEVYGGAISFEVPGAKESGIALTLEPYDEWDDAPLYDMAFSDLVGDDGVIRINEDTNGHALLRTALGSHHYYGGHPLDP